MWRTWLLISRAKPILEVQEAFGLTQVVKLSSNECPFDLPEKLGPVLAKAAVTANRYPDALCRRLRTKVAKALGVDESNLIFGNGAEECIRLIAQIFFEPRGLRCHSHPDFRCLQHGYKADGGNADPPSFEQLSH